MKWFVALWVVVVAGCSTWRTVEPSSIYWHTFAEDKPRVIVATEIGAFEMDTQAADLETVYGTSVKEWDLPGWSEREAQHAVAIPTREIREVRVRKSAPVGWIVAGSLGAALMLTLCGAIIVGGLTAMSGRPLRVDGTARVARTQTSSEWLRTAQIVPVDDDVRERLASLWTGEAQAEHASVAAFARISLELIALGAPPQLVARAHHAALQEIEHARLCFSVASAYRGQPVGPAPFPDALAPTTPDLVRLARESAVDGWLGEALAAELARLGSEVAADPHVARILRVISADEAAHAELSRDIALWCLEQDEGLRAVLQEAVTCAPVPRREALPEHGRIGGAVLEMRFAVLRANVLRDLRPQRGKLAEPERQAVGTPLE